MDLGQVSMKSTFCGCMMRASQGTSLSVSLCLLTCDHRNTPLCWTACMWSPNHASREVRLLCVSQPLFSLLPTLQTAAGCIGLFSEIVVIQDILPCISFRNSHPSSMTHSLNAFLCQTVALAWVSHQWRPQHWRVQRSNTQTYLLPIFGLSELQMEYMLQPSHKPPVSWLNSVPVQRTSGKSITSAQLG